MNRHTQLALTMREPHALGGRPAAVQAAQTEDGNVALILDPHAAQELAQIIARRDPATPPDAMLEAERDPDDTTWTHVVVDLLAASVMTRLDIYTAAAVAAHPSNGPALRVVGGAQ